VRHHRLKTWIIAVNACIACASAARASDIPLFVFAGQSNAVGYGTDSTQLTAAQLANQPNVLWAGQQNFGIAWQFMHGPTEIGSQILSGHGFGPELTGPLTISSANSHQLVAAVKYAVNNTGLDSTFSPTWNPATASGLYSQMLARVTNARNSLPSSPLAPANSTTHVAGFFWMQGEKDSENEATADDYQYNLTQLIGHVRTDLGDANLPFVLGEISATYATFSPAVRRIQANVARVVPHTAFVPTDGFAKFSDTFHFNSAGMYDLGTAFGNAYQSIVTAPPAAAPTSISNHASNGSFEDYQVARFKAITQSGSLNISAVPTDILPGWKVIGSGATLVTAGGFDSSAGTRGSAQPSEGSQFLALRNGPSGFGGAIETFTSAAGEAYRISFDYSAISRGNNATSSFTYDLGGALTTLSVSTSGVANFFTAPWQTRSVDFVATGSLTTLRFLPLEAGDNSFYGSSIDNVRIIAGRQWVGNDTSWNTASNWIGGVPDAIDAPANFLGQISSAATISTGSSSFTVGSMKFDNANAYTIAGSGTLVLRVSNGNATIDVERGSHTIATPLVLGNDATINVAPANSTLALTGPLTATGNTITKAGAGTAQFDNIRAARLDLTAGRAQITAKASSNAAVGTSVVESLSISSGAVLDVTNNAAVIDYTGPVGSLVDDIRQQIQSGRLISSSGDAVHALAYADNALLGQSSVGGTTVDASSIVIDLALAGDANLDGVVDVSDLGALATNWQSSGVWTSGDFNYDGITDVADLGFLAENWQATASLSETLASFGLPTSVPETPCVTVAFIVMAALRRRAPRTARAGTQHPALRKAL
jgi:hypothetical protein